MLIVLITRFRNKFMFIIRLLMFFAILIILLGQIFAAILNSGLPDSRLHDTPENKPMRVEKKEF